MNRNTRAAHKALLKAWTPRKAKNALRILLSYYLSRWRRIPMMMGFPFSVSIEPTTSCNLRCPECPSGLRSFSRPTGMLSPDLFNAFLNQTEGHLVYLNFYFQGEPFLHPTFLDLVEGSVRRSIFTSTSTNAHYLNVKTAERVVDSGLHRLIISLDGASQDVYAAYRKGGQVEKVLEGIKNVAEARKRKGKLNPEIVVQNLLVKPNIHEKQQVELLAKSLGADRVVFKTAQVYDLKADHYLVPDEPEFSRYKKTEGGGLEIKNPLLNQCWRMWSGCVITWDGKVVPCCFDKDASHQMGTLQEAPFVKIWQSESYQNFRRAILSSRSEIDICKNCTEGTKVWA
ncbi:MAG: SPASM domain-containing protein [Bacteroidia bacterium]|jgi:radical SAM protein with 4Fe4S-binding SPASM domain